MSLQPARKYGRRRAIPSAGPSRSIGILTSLRKAWTDAGRDERGLEVVEFAIIAGWIVAAALVVLAAIGVWVLGIYQQLQTTVNA